MNTESVLGKILKSGNMAVTSECGPPRGTSAGKVRAKAKVLKNYVDAVNVTDNQTAMVRMSSLSASIILRQQGLHPVLQMVTRDRNRLAIQSDVLGAYAHGINTILCLSGDHTSFGDHPMAASVHDIDSTQLINMIKNMRDKGIFQGGSKIDNPPNIFIGGAANPFADPFELRVARLAKKILAGVNFIQTQCVYNVEKFKLWLKILMDKGLHEKCFILAGVMPLKSSGMARYIKNKVPGMDIPQYLVDRMDKTPKEKQAQEGIDICVELMEELKSINGLSGFHIMAIEWEDKVPEIVRRAGLFPRPSFD